MERVSERSASQSFFVPQSLFHTYSIVLKSESHIYSNPCETGSSGEEKKA